MNCDECGNIVTTITKANFRALAIKGVGHSSQIGSKICLNCCKIFKSGEYPETPFVKINIPLEEK